jgi:hypothetical protein
MISSKVSKKLTETLTATEQIPSILNNNYVKIGGGVFIFIIFVIILYYSFRYISSASAIQIPDPIIQEPIPIPDPIIQESIQPKNKNNNNRPLRQNNCEFFSDCNFKNMTKEDKIKYVTAGISVSEIDKITNIDKQIKLNNMYIKSLKTNNVKITLYSNSDFTGEIIKLENNNNYNIDCLEKPMKSVIIDIINNIQIRNI